MSSCEKEGVVMMQTNRNMHANKPWSNQPQMASTGLMHGYNGANNTQNQELPHKSPERAVTKTRSSLGRKKKVVCWFRVIFTGDSYFSFVRHSWTDDRQLGRQGIAPHALLKKPQRSLLLSHKHQQRTLNLDRGVLSLLSSPSIFVLSGTHKRTN